MLVQFHRKKVLGYKSHETVIFLVNGLGEIKAIGLCTEAISLVVLFFVAFFSFMEGMTTDKFSEVLFQPIPS